jgi:alpha-galactosidase
MVKITSEHIRLDTENTTLLFKIQKEYVEILYYGKKLFSETNYNVFGNEIYMGNVGCEDYITARLPFSYTGIGNGTESFVILKNADGSYVNRFEFIGAEVEKINNDFDKFAHSRNKKETLVLKYFDKYSNVTVELRYSVFDKSDIIAVKSYIKYSGKGTIEVLRCMSLQTDFWGDDFEITTFDGTWGKERNLHIRTIASGVFINDSKVGASSNKHNPFFMLNDKRHKKYYGFNLIYSGNHKEIVEVTAEGRVHVLVGLNDYLFNYKLECGDSFESPEAIMVVTNSEESVTEQMHSFVINHIIDPNFAHQERPVLLNNWEATYYDFNRDKLVALLEKAKEVGVELFVLDDGWFGHRNDESSSLGDWMIENPKVQGGIAEFSACVKAAGLKFGIWMEPEMISEDSELFRKHPEYAMANRRAPLRRRNQLMLDLTNPKVQQYVIDCVLGVVEKYQVDYIKWDYNRNMFDMFGCEIDNQGEYFHRYICGLYHVLAEIRKATPNVLFESCASGGNRYDLGMLYYMPQVWASDNTDAYDRLFIQEGTLYAYPQNTMGAHVSVCPNHQTGNSVSIENRFNVAAMGLLGYELDLTSLETIELEAIKEQIIFYKVHRQLIQNGVYYRLDRACDGNYAGAIIVSKDKTEAVAFVCVKRKVTGQVCYRFSFTGLDEEKTYRVVVRKQCDVEKDIEFTACGTSLMSGSVYLGELFDETSRLNYSASLASRLVYIKGIK